MARIVEHVAFEFESPYIVEGLPGVGLVGKIAVDHLVETLEMEHVASCYCEGLPRVATYQNGSYEARPPVRIYGDQNRELLALQSDVPVSPQNAAQFAGCVTGWFDSHGITPICLSGLPAEKDGVPEMYGIATGDDSALDSHGIDPPTESGMIRGPTGALLAEAEKQDLDGVGLVVESNQQFPDPEAARVLLVDAIEPITGIAVDTETLVDQAEEIADAREKLAQRMQQADDESSQAQPLGMYH